MKTVSKLAMMIAALTLAGSPVADAEIVERELGTDASGQTVTGYVFQGGRSSRGSISRRSSGLARRHFARPSRSAGRIDRGYTTGHGAYWVIPVIPLHGCGGYSLWRGTSRNFSITVIR